MNKRLQYKLGLLSLLIIGSVPLIGMFWFVHAERIKSQEKLAQDLVYSELGRRSFDLQTLENISRNLRVGANAEYVVAKENLPTNTILTEQNMEVKRLYVTRMSDCYQSTKFLKGQKLFHPVPYGQPISNYHVRVMNSL